MSLLPNFLEDIGSFKKKKSKLNGYGQTDRWTEREAMQCLGRLNNQLP